MSFVILTAIVLLTVSVLTAYSIYELEKDRAALMVYGGHARAARNKSAPTALRRSA
jgi:hypothetical protein